MKQRKTILIGALNWGLGHATRCMPLINAFIQQGAHVIIASDGDALRLLQVEYPTLDYLELPPYNINYKTANMFVNMAPQIPKILKAIRLERQFLKTIISKQKIDAIISDNRYGLHHPDVPSVFMTHQLNIQVPNRWVQAWVRRMNQGFINNFDACWVPDFEKEPNLAGILSHGTGWKQLEYLGLLSRLDYSEEEKIYDVIAVLSGPEPQRSIFEQKIIEQAKLLPHSFLILGGKTSEEKVEQLAPNIQRHAYMASKELNRAILQSKMLVARSGYSSLMDIVRLQCPQVLLVPTPGQTEQEYLAKRFSSQKLCLEQQQSKLDLSKAIGTFEKGWVADYQKIKAAENLTKVIEKFLSEL